MAPSRGLLVRRAGRCSLESVVDLRALGDQSDTLCCWGDDFLEADEKDFDALKA